MIKIYVLILWSLLFLHAINTNRFGALEKVKSKVLIQKGQYPLTLWRVVDEKTVCVDGVHTSMLDGEIKDVSVTLSSDLVWILTDKSTLYLMDAKRLFSSIKF